jgi:hypothetical protein
MAWPMMKRLKKYVLLALGVWAATQAVEYWVLIDSVDRTVGSQLMVYHKHGEGAYRQAVTANLAKMGLRVREGDFITREDRVREEFQAEIHYEWPLRLLVFTFDRPNVARARTIMADG